MTNKLLNDLKFLERNIHKSQGLFIDWQQFGIEVIRLIYKYNNRGET